MRSAAVGSRRCWRAASSSAHSVGAALGSGAAAPERASALPGNLYAPRVVYAAAAAPAPRNPVRHTYADVGRYFDLCPEGDGGGSDGGPAALAAAFPEGIAGDLPTEFEGARTSARSNKHT